MKKLIICIAFAISFQTVFSQKKKNKRANDSIKTEVIEVVTTYNPIVADAFKIKTEPKLKLGKNSDKKKMNYAFYSAPVASTFIPKSGAVKGIDVGVKERVFNNYISAGFGNFTTPYLDLYLHKITRFNNEFGIYGNYIGSSDGVKNTVLDSGFKMIHVGGFYEQMERYFTWKIDGNASIHTYNWYGLPNISFDDLILNNLEEQQNYTNVEVNGEITFEDSYFKNITSSINYFTDDFSSKEISAKISPNFIFPWYTFRSIDNLKLNTTVEYTSGSFKNDYVNREEVNYGFLNLTLNPYVNIEGNKLDAKLGFTFTTAFDLENSATHFLIYPDVYVNYPISKDKLSIFAGATGGLTTNTFQSLTDQNPFISPTQFLTQTNEQYNVFGGVQVREGNINLGIKALYKSTEDQPLFIRNTTKSNGTFDPNNLLLGYEYGNSFSVIYDDIQTLSFVGEIEAEINKRTILGLSATYNNYKLTQQTNPWHLPNFEGTLYAKYNHHKWYVISHLLILGERNAKLYSTTNPTIHSGVKILDAITDISIQGGYSFTDRLSAFVKASNLLNQEYQSFSNFRVQGLQILGGLTFNFDF